MQQLWKQLDKNVKKCFDQIKMGDANPLEESLNELLGW